MNSWCVAKRPTYVSAAEAARILGGGLQAATIRKWAERERIYAKGLDRSGRPLYDLDDIRACHKRAA